MASKIDIANKALVLLGADTIASFTEGTDRARAVDQLYPTLRDSLLSMRSWRFSLARRQLAQLTSEPLFGWDHAYQLPSDRLTAPLAVYDDDATGAVPRTHWDVNGERLLANFEQAWIVYQARPAETDWPEYFVQLMVLALAADLAFFITDNASLEQGIRQRAFGVPSENGYGGQYRIASHRDMQLETLPPIQANDLIVARFGGLYPDYGFGGW